MSSIFDEYGISLDDTAIEIERYSLFNPFPHMEDFFRSDIEGWPSVPSLALTTLTNIESRAICAGVPGKTHVK